MITLNDLNQAFADWHHSALLLDAMVDHPNITTKMIADAMQNERHTFAVYVRLLNGYFTRSDENAPSQNHD